MQVTFETALTETNPYPLFVEIARLYAEAEHRLFVDHYVLGIPLRICKQESLLRFGLTARQFNAVAFNLKGKVKAVREGQGDRVAHLQRSIAASG